MKNFTIVAVIQDRILRVDSDGTEAGTKFEGRENDVQKAMAVARLSWDVRMGVGGVGMGMPPTVRAGFGSPLELAASMMAVAPQYVYFWHAPKEVQELMKSFYVEKPLKGKCR